MTERRRFISAALAVLLCGAIVSGVVQFWTYAHRIKVTSPTGGVSGFEFLAGQRPVDSQLIAFLGRLKGNIVLVEECGMPPKPTAYGVAGRISAYSGRHALCGWGMHSYLHQPVLKRDGASGVNVWSYLEAVERDISLIMSAAPNMKPDQLQRIDSALKALRSAGATHIVFGEYEKSVHPTGDVRLIADAVGGRIIFNIGGFGIVEIEPLNSSGRG